MKRKFLRKAIPDGVTLISLDVFDTLLLRNQKSEIFRFYEVAREQLRLLSQRGCTVSSEELFHARLLCAKIGYQTAEKNRGERDAKLIDILALVKEFSGVSEYVDEQELLRVELEYEKNNLELNQEIINSLEELKDNFEVVLLSDTYFQKNELLGLVQSFSNFSFDNIFSSCEYSLTKSGGGLFNYLMEVKGCRPENILHVGDNRHSDVNVPRSMGCHVRHVPRPKYLSLCRLLNQMYTGFKYRQVMI